MGTYALTQNVRTGSCALVGADGSFEFPPADGPLLASMFAAEWPKCEECQDRACEPCERCGDPGCMANSGCPACDGEDDDAEGSDS